MILNQALMSVLVKFLFNLLYSSASLIVFLFLFVCFSLFHYAWNIFALLLNNHFFTYANRKNVCFLSGCSFAVLESLGVEFSFCYYRWFPFCQLLCSGYQFLRSCAPFYSSEDQKYLGKNKKKSRISSARKGLLVRILLLIPIVSLSHTHMYIKVKKSHCYRSMFVLDSFMTETGLVPGPGRDQVM